MTVVPPVATRVAIKQLGLKIPWSDRGLSDGLHFQAAWRKDEGMHCMTKLTSVFSCHAVWPQVNETCPFEWWVSLSLQLENSIVVEDTDDAYG